LLDLRQLGGDQPAPGDAVAERGEDLCDSREGDDTEQQRKGNSKHRTHPLDLSKQPERFGNVPCLAYVLYLF